MWSDKEKTGEYQLAMEEPPVPHDGEIVLGGSGGGADQTCPLPSSHRWHQDPIQQADRAVGDSMEYTIIIIP